MTRTQIIIDTWQHKFISALARKRGVSLSALLREWIDEKAAAAAGRPEQDPLLGLAGIVEDRADDVSERADDYLYGSKPPKE